MMDVLPMLPWHLAAGLAALVLAALLLRWRGGQGPARVGTVLLWLAVVLALAWFLTSAFAAMQLLRG